MQTTRKILCPFLALTIGLAGCGMGLSWKEIEDLPERDHPKDIRVQLGGAGQMELKSAYVDTDTLYGIAHQNVLFLEDSTPIDLSGVYLEEGFLIFPDSSSIEIAAVEEAFEAEEAALGRVEQEEAIPLAHIRTIEEERFDWLTLGGDVLLAIAMLAVLAALVVLEQEAELQ